LTTEKKNELEAFLIQKLGIDEQASIQVEPAWQDFSFDMVIEDPKKSQKYYIEIKTKASLDSLAQINLFKDVMLETETISDLHFVLAGKYISTKTGELAEGLNIRTLIIPREIALPGEGSRIQGSVKITSEKSWKVVSGLIGLKSSSIRNLSIILKVSYGWTHATMKQLISHGLARTSGNQVSISDMDKLLNGVAWERPTNNLIVKEFTIPNRDIFEAAKELANMFESQGIRYAFASYFAGTQYTGESIRFDSIQVYLEKKDIEDIGSQFGWGEGLSGIKLQIMGPDRELFSESRSTGGVRITSPSQTLLDLAGLGYKGKDLTKSMVALYGQLSRSELNNPEFQ
jgi:hypothetical protein